MFKNPDYPLASLVQGDKAEDSFRQAMPVSQAGQHDVVSSGANSTQES